MVSVNVKMKGFDKAIVKISGIGTGSQEIVRNVLETAGFKTQAVAVKSIINGPATGRIYERYRPRRTHQASAFGQAPASDTGQLATSITVEGVGTNLVSVGTNLPYGRYLEFGTNYMSHRQWLTPAFEVALAGIGKDAKLEFKRKFG